MPIHLFAYIHRIRSFSQIVNMRFTQLSFFRHSVQKQYIKFVSFYQKIFFIFENCLCLKNSCTVLNATFFASPYTGEDPPPLPEEIRDDFVKINRKKQEFCRGALRQSGGKLPSTGWSLAGLHWRW